MKELKRDVYHAIADPTRREILGLLAGGPRTPNELAAHFDSSRQAISKHIQVLVACSLVEQEPVGREIYYAFNAKKLREVDRWLQRFRSLWEARFNQLDAVLKNPKK